MPASQYVAIGKSYLQSPLLGSLLHLVFAFFLVVALICEILPLATEAMQGVKHLTRIIQDFVRHSSRT